MKLEITKEKVLEAAAKCETSKETLKTLFPEVFEQGMIKYNSENQRFEIDGFAALYIDFQYSDGHEFHLDSNFNWELKKVNLGYQLIPTRK